MSRKFQENVIAIITLVVFCAYLITALSFGPNARLVPLPIATLGIFLVLIQIIRQNLSSSEKLELDLLSSLTGTTNKVAITEKKPPKENPHQLEREIRAFMFVATFVGLILLAGPVVAVFVFASGFFILTSYYAPIKAIWISALFCLALYILFVEILQLQLYHGILEPLIIG
ncbi:MAG: hypothetical protein CMM56_07345 [Rhodospirillaceae bacterium]|nr:hypothetical protein [Rhodospirillaceae bacterium]|tara:strand:+ start:13 stop:528 length:516 start_codon:yes stop_codon:yes gene_type:complete